VAGQSSPKGPGKISVECPHCTSRQQESVFAKTTFCRKCGKHFDLERKAAPVPAGAKETSFFSRLTRFLSREKIRTIHCFDCKKEHQVSSFAKSSFCSSCGGYIDLRDFKITGNFSRSIQTQGKIIIGPKGDVTSSKIACGEAVIRGKLQGNLLCSGKVRIKFKGRVIGALDVKHLVVEKRSNIEFVRPLKVGIAEINGKVSARVNADSIKIGKTGTLDGTVYAKAISVEKGGFCLGSLFIGKQELSQPELIPEPKASPSGIMNLGNQSVLAL
jgi:cytoskeletal protein CcmA (bactofilin family)/endogenous inhibitor of DNA gyrase (YacG/DUF329 family)